MQIAWRVWVRYVIPVKTGPYKRLFHCFSENPEAQRLYDVGSHYYLGPKKCHPRSFGVAFLL